MDTLGISDLPENLEIFAAVVMQWVPVSVGLACFVGLAAMCAVSFLRARH